MILAIIILLAVLWFLGYFSFSALAIPNIVLFNLNGQPITLWTLLIFLVIIWAIGVLPSPFRQIAGVVLVLWILSTLGILAIGGLASILVIALIAGLILFLIGA